VAVTTYTTSGFGASGYDVRDIVICLDATRAIGVAGTYLLQFAAQARLYGILPAGVHLAPRDWDNIHELFGFARAEIPSHGKMNMPVDVIFTRMSGGRMVTGDDLVRLKRERVWRNRPRNRRIARLAVGLAQGDAETAAPFFADNAILPANLSKPRSVVLLVDNCEQRDEIMPEIARRRRNWPTRMNGFEPGPWLSVATAAEFDDVDLRATNVIVRADAGVGLLPQLNSRSLEVPCESCQRLLLVDTSDDDIPVLRARTEMRAQAYAQHGWIMIGANAVGTAVTRFLTAKSRETK
jgi:hypothetical protein